MMTLAADRHSAHHGRGWTRKLSGEGAGMQSEAWTVERVDLLRRLWGDGETAAAIAVRLGGMSRSAVLGKVFRLRLAGPVSGKTAQEQRSAAERTQNAGDVHVARRRRSPKRAHQQQPSLNAATRGR